MYMTKRNTLKLIAAYAVLAGAAGLFGACSQKEVAFASIDVTGAEYAKDFALPDHNGKMRQLKDFAGKVVVVFFGYTQCPDVCPTSMSELAEVKRLLGKDGDRVQGIFVTVDPARDTPEVLKAYMEAFDPTFLALTTTPDTLSKTAKDFKVYYKKSEGKTDTSYTMDHSAGSYVYDTKGQLRLFTRYGSGAAPLAKDIAILLQQGTGA
jgi:protein SCO1/2